jgi:hypothetical protein
VNGSVESEAIAEGGTESDSLPTPSGTYDYAYTGVLTALSGLGPNVGAAFNSAGAVTFGSASLGIGVGPNNTSEQLFSTSVGWNVSTATLAAGSLELGLAFPYPTGSFDTMDFQVAVDGNRVVDQTFGTPAAATAYFSDNLLDLGALPSAGQVNGSVTVTVSLTASASASNREYGIDVMVGDVVCFVVGTLIATLAGEVPIESLSIGDLVWTQFAGLAPIEWIGYRQVECHRHPKPDKVWPICVAADAFGPGRPYRDLWLSPDHSVFVDDVLIPIKYLLNGTTVAQVPRRAVTYYHVELHTHDVLLAQGLPAESYLDTGDRGRFANGGGAIALYPDFASRVWESEGCAPLIMTGPQLATAQSWVNAAANRCTNDVATADSFGR